MTASATASAVWPCGQGQEGEVAGRPLDDGGDGGVGRLRAHDEVALVVAGDQAALGLGGPLADRDGADDLAAPVGPAAAAADRAARPQAGLQLLAELPAGVEVDRLVDRLVADPHRRVVGELHLQPPAGLLGRVPSVQHGLHFPPQGRVPAEFRRLGAALPLPRQPVGPLGLVGAGAGVGVAFELAADRRRGPAEAGRDLPLRQARLRQPGDLVAFLAVEVAVVVGRLGGSVHPAHPLIQLPGVLRRHAGRLAPPGAGSSPTSARPASPAPAPAPASSRPQPTTTPLKSGRCDNP